METPKATKTEMRDAIIATVLPWFKCCFEKRLPAADQAIVSHYVGIDRLPAGVSDQLAADVRMCFYACLKRKIENGFEQNNLIDLDLKSLNYAKGLIINFTLGSLYGEAHKEAFAQARVPWSSTYWWEEEECSTLDLVVHSVLPLPAYLDMRIGPDGCALVAPTPLPPVVLVNEHALVEWRAP